MRRRGDYVYSGTDSIELHWTDEHGEKGKPNCPGRRLPVSSNAWWMRGAIWRHPPSVSRCSRMKRSLSAANTAC